VPRQTPTSTEAEAQPEERPQEEGVLRIVPVRDTTEHIRKWMLYGRSGSGKTYMAGTFPAPLIIDLEGGAAGTLPLVRQGKKILKVPATGGVQSYGEFLAILDVIEELAKGPNPPFKTLVVDSVNQIQFLAVQDIVQLFDKNREYDDQLTRSDYGKLARMMELVTYRILNIPVPNVILICGTQQQDAESTIWPALLGAKSVPHMLRLCDAVGYCWSERVSADGQDRTEYRVSFTNCEHWVAKVRGIELPFDGPNVYPL
jgi:hypothetical protein